MGSKYRDTGCTVESIVTSGLCRSCGACVCVCPRQAIDITISPAGGHHATVDTVRCVRCGRCLTVCPCAAESLSSSTFGDPFLGPTLAAVLARASKEELRVGGQSGGVVGALCEYLLGFGLVDAVVAATSCDDGTLGSRPVVVRNSRDIWKIQGSRYTASSVLMALRECDSQEKVAVVGLPCHIQGLDKLSILKLPRLPKIDIRVGLICDRIMLDSAGDALVRYAGISRENVRDIIWRDKLRAGWPGEVCLLEFDGTHHFMSGLHRQRLKDYVTPIACRACFDKFNVLADIVVGDPWGIDNDGRGYSVVLIRTPAGQLIIDESINAGVIIAHRVKPASVFMGQCANEKKRDYCGYCEALSRSGINVLQAKQFKRPQKGLFSMFKYSFQLALGRYVSSAPTRRVAVRRVACLQKCLAPVFWAKTRCIGAVRLIRSFLERGRD